MTLTRLLQRGESEAALADINESASARANGDAAGRAPRKQQSIEIVGKTKREPSRCSAARAGEEAKISRAGSSEDQAGTRPPGTFVGTPPCPRHALRAC